MMNVTMPPATHSPSPSWIFCAVVSPNSRVPLVRRRACTQGSVLARTVTATLGKVCVEGGAALVAEMAVKANCASLVLLSWLVTELGKEEGLLEGRMQPEPAVSSSPVAGFTTRHTALSL